MADTFSDNPLVGFRQYRDAHAGEPGSDARLARDGLSTYRLDRLEADVLADRLPQVAWIVAGAKESEHPGPSSPAEGADFTARVLDALTANPQVWAKTVLLVMFDENDGFFDHLPPPAPPSRDAAGRLIGGSTVDLVGEHHRVRPKGEPVDRADLVGRPYGLGPRAPMYVISPWSRGGWVNSEVFDHTSVIRFLEARFGVEEPNISPWRRAVCGDLTSAFDFKTPNREPRPPRLPATAETAARARALGHTTRPPTPATPQPPIQASGVRRSRALPYVLDVSLGAAKGRIAAAFANTGRRGAVIHVYDLKDLSPPPRRFTIEAGKTLGADWRLAADGTYDLWMLGPNGFHRRFRGRGAGGPLVRAIYDRTRGGLSLDLRNATSRPLEVRVVPNAYVKACLPQRVILAPGATARRSWTLADSAAWYDLAVTVIGDPAFLQRYAGRVETGRPSISDPEMGGPAVMSWA
jgi:phospholipase C